MDISAALAPARYPGRGLLVVHPAREGSALLYFLTGRSPASRGRVLVGDGTDLHAMSTTGAGHDPLRHYRAATVIDDLIIVGNGDHVDAIAEMATSSTLVDALRALEPEPDPPLHTARIVAALERSSGAVFVGAARGVPGSTGFDHLACIAREVPPGLGLLIATYSGGVEQPDTWAVPTWIDAADTLVEQVKATWGALSREQRVSLASRHALDSAWSVVSTT